VLTLECSKCYFLTSASSSTPIVYEVERIRNGRSYVTRAVKAIQNGRIVFVMMCSFHKPETWQPGHQWPMPTVPSPEKCQLEESLYTTMVLQGDLHPKLVETYKILAAVR
jgi:acyl-CoA thioesterase 8